MNIPDHISESSETIFGAKNTFNSLIWIQIEKIGSATLVKIVIIHIYPGSRAKLITDRVNPDPELLTLSAASWPSFIASATVPTPKRTITESVSP